MTGSKLLAVFLYGALPSAPTLSCQDRDEGSTSRVRAESGD